MTAGSWLMASVKVVCTTQSSLATVAVCGRSSLIQTPRSLFSYFWKAYFEGQTGSVFCFEVIPVMRCPSRMCSGSSSPNISRIFGL